MFDHIGVSDYSQIYLAYSTILQRYVAVKIVFSFKKMINDTIIKPFSGESKSNLIHVYLNSFEKIKNIL